MEKQPKKKIRNAKRERDPSQSSEKKQSAALKAADKRSVKPCQSNKKARATPSSLSAFPPVLRIYTHESKKDTNTNTIFDVEKLSARACQLWRSPSGGQQSAMHHRPAGVCRRLGVISMEFILADDALSKKISKRGGKKKKQKAMPATELTDDQISNLLVDKNITATNAMSWKKPSSGRPPSKTDARKDVAFIYGEDYHHIPGNPTQTSLIKKIQDEWSPIVAAGRVVPQWNKFGEYVDPSAATTCRHILKLLRTQRLIDPHPARQAVMYQGLEHIPIDALSILEAIVDLSDPTEALYGAPLLVSLPRIKNIERIVVNSKKRSPKVYFSIGIYANRLLFDVMTQKLQIVMAALEKESFAIKRGLSTPPSLPSSPDEDAVFASDPKGPKVRFGFDESSVDSDNEDNVHTSGDEDASKDFRKSRKYSAKEFDDVGASDGTLDAFTPSGFLKLVENTGTNMDRFEILESLLGDKLQVELMLHQKHALSFMYKMEHLEHGINSLIWEQRTFPEGGDYFYSPILGQLRLALGHNVEPLRGGILADEMGLGKTCSVLALIVASLPEIKHQVAKEKKAGSNTATLIIVPPALLSQWVSEVFKVAGDNLTVDVFDHNSLEFERRSNHPVSEFDADVVLTTYQSLEKARKGYSSKAANILLSTHWARVVLDEMQEVRSHTSSISKNCNALMANRRWMLSGTPLFEGFSDFRGELCFLRLDPFAADTEDGFFDFAITRHLDNRNRFGLETLRVLGLLLLRRSKSMVVKETNLPLLGLKPMTVKFQPVPQDVSERAIYCFLEHLMHSVLVGNVGKEKSSRQSDKARAEKRSFLRVLREICASVHLLNGGHGCTSQIPILARWMKTYNRKFIERRQIPASSQDDDDEIFTCDEAIRFISQADDEVNQQSDFVSDLRLGHGGGVASRSRATADKVREKIEDTRYQIGLKQTSIIVCRRKQAKLRWHRAFESVTSGGLPLEEYAKTGIFFQKLWTARRTSPFGHGWRPKPMANGDKYLEMILKRLGCKWATPAAVCVSEVPIAVSREELVVAILKCIENDMKRRNVRDILGKIEVIKNGVEVISSQPQPTSTCWKGLVLLPDSRLVDILVHQTSGTHGIRIKAKASLPLIEEQAARAKERFEIAETMAIIHPTEKSRSKKNEMQREYEIARRLRAFGNYKEGHVLLTRAHTEFRLTDRPRSSILQSMRVSLQTLEQSIEIFEEEIDALRKDMGSLQTRMLSECSEKAKGLTAVEALQALQHGRAEETTCPVCQETLGDNGGLVAATQCGHLSCSECMEDWKKEKQHQTLTCMECRKQINRIVTIDPRKKEDERAVEERKNDALRLVQKAAKQLKENGNGALDPSLWRALYETLELPDDTDTSRDRHFPAIPGELLGHVRVVSRLPIHSGPKTTDALESVALSSKIRALLKDLPRDELSVVFTSSKSFLMHILHVLDFHGIGCRGLFTGQKELESKAALDDWHNETNVEVLVVQAGAAACGLTLTASSNLFLMEPFLKYEEEQQAYARLHRYGQKSQVSCTVYYSPVSIESRLLEWRKQSNGFLTQDEEVEFASLDGSSADERENGDSDSDESESDHENEELEEEENQTRYLLNLQS